MKRQFLFTMILATTIAGAARAQVSDPVLDWNAISTQAILNGGHPGATTILDMAVVQAAVHDAVQAYDKRFEPYAVEISNAAGSVAAAVAKATHDVLVNRFPAQAATLGTTYADYLAAHGLAANDPGVLVGQQVAAAILVLRANDGSFPATPPPPFVGANLPGVWRPTPSLLPGPPPSFAPMAFTWVAEVTPFVVLSPTQFAAPPPPRLNSGRYARDYAEVKALGSLNSTARTPEQTQLAYFYADNFIAQINRAVRGIAETYLDNSGDTARLFALAWMVAADGFITTWDCKIHYALWRPISAIREGDNDGNRRTVGDPAWQPFLNTPNYPDYSSGANALVGGITRLLRLYFGTDEVTFTVTSNNPLANPNLRTYERFSDAAQDVVDVRIYQGIHFRFADDAARKLGGQVAKWTFENALRPLDGDCEDHEDEGEDYEN
jgi:hypothetical protein